MARPIMSPVATTKSTGTRTADGFEQAAAILDRLDKMEALLGVNKGEVGIMERLTHLETRLDKLEQAVGMAEIKDSAKKVEQNKAPPHHQAQTSSRSRSPPKTAVDENNKLIVVASRNPSEQGLNYTCGCSQTGMTHEQLKQYCRKEIFKCMKFLSPKQEELHSVQPGTVGYVIVKEFNIDEKRQKSWWILHSQIVQKTIAHARNCVSSEIKRTVRSKSTFLLMMLSTLFVYRTSSHTYSCITHSFYSLDLLLENCEIGSKGCKVPSLERILKLREDEDAFEFLVNHIFGCVYGRRAWNVLKTNREASKELSISDEAFAIVVLENNWNVLTETDPKKAKLKYTVEDGWSRAGVARFNKLYELVMADREKNSLVDRKVKERLFFKERGVKRSSEEADPMSDLTSSVHNQGHYKRQAF